VKVQEAFAWISSPGHESKITCVAACRRRANAGSVQSDGSRPRVPSREALVVTATIARGPAPGPHGRCG